MSFFVELSIMIMERLYLDPGVKEVHAYGQKYLLLYVISVPNLFEVYGI